jgi:2-haloalkanoic acid dehalogenase type II
MDSITTWSSAARDRELGLAWRDAVTQRMADAGRYVPYEELVRAAATDLQLDADADVRLVAAWREMEPWPDAAAMRTLRVPYGFVTNCSATLARQAVARSGLRPTFTLSAEEAGWYKPHPETYRLACQRLGLEPTEIRFVAGAAYDALGAKAAELQTVLVTRRPPPPALPGDVMQVASLDEALDNLD